MTMMIVVAEHLSGRCSLHSMPNLGFYLSRIAE